MKCSLINNENLSSPQTAAGVYVQEWFGNMKNLAPVTSHAHKAHRPLRLAVDQWLFLSLFFAPICSQMMSGVKRGNGSEWGGEGGTNKKRLSRTERSCPHASQRCSCDVLKPADLQHVQEEEGGEKAFVGVFAIICCKQFSKGEWGTWKGGLGPFR